MPKRVPEHAGGVKLIAGLVLEVHGPSQGPSRNRSYSVRWTLPDGQLLTVRHCSTRDLAGTDDQIDRLAFARFMPVVGMMTGTGRSTKFTIADVEPYAFGCLG